MQNNPSTRRWRAFLALAEQRSFTRAAALLHLSQPAFSALIRAVEDEVGARLFDRTTRSVELTAEGAVLEPAARRIVEETEAALDDVREHAARRRGRVAVAVLPALAAGWLPPLLASFQQAHPGIAFDVADVLSEECLERVRAGRADFALAATRAETSALRAEPFCSDAFHLVCRVDHPLAGRTRLRLADVAAHPLVHLARSSSVRQYVDAALQPRVPRTVMALEQLSTVAGMVRAGLGVTIVPALTLFHFNHPELVARALGAPLPPRQIFLVRRRDRALSTAAQALCEHLRRHKPVTARATPRATRMR